MFSTETNTPGGNPGNYPFEINRPLRLYALAEEPSNGDSLDDIQLATSPIITEVAGEAFSDAWSGLRRKFRLRSMLPGGQPSFSGYDRVVLLHNHESTRSLQQLPTYERIGSVLLSTLNSEMYEEALDCRAADIAQVAVVKTDTDQLVMLQPKEINTPELISLWTQRQDIHTFLQSKTDRLPFELDSDELGFGIPIARLPRALSQNMADWLCDHMQGAIDQALMDVDNPVEHHYLDQAQKLDYDTKGNLIPVVIR